MKPQQFIAPTAREALAMVRRSIGPDAVILSNRAVTEGVAVTAIAERDLDQLETAPMPVPVRDSSSAPVREQAAASPVPSEAPVTASDEPMSTVSFEAFTNERRAQLSDALLPQATNEERSGSQVKLHQSEPVPMPARTPAGEPITYMQSMVEELRQMRGFIRQQFSALAWVDGVRRTPGQARLLKRMIEAGFSARLARVMVSRLPVELNEAQADQWLHEGLVRNLRTACFDHGLLQQGGVFALVGPTGVGKTTSAAKIAAQYALQHGPESIGLISGDVYRVAGQEQLARYGRMIGTKVHTARTADELAELLIRLQDRSLVLIDTAGLGQRDPRVADLLDFVDQGPIRRLVVMSASAQAEAIDETLDAYGALESAGVLLTKIDEACRLGGALDTLIRYRLPLHAVGNGQRVPEDWQPADAEQLIAQALTQGVPEAFQLSDIDLTMLMQRIEPIPPDDDRANQPVSTQEPSSGGARHV